MNDDDYRPPTLEDAGPQYTIDGVKVTMGMRVFTYDADEATVIDIGSIRQNMYMGEPRPGYTVWYIVEADGKGQRRYDGSRMWARDPRTGRLPHEAR